MGGESPRRSCPACVRREAALADPSCPICHGSGVLYLGAGALSIYPAATVSLAAEYHLEAVSRLALAASPTAAGLALAVKALRTAVADLTRVGVLAARPHKGRYPVDRQWSPTSPADAAALVPLHEPQDGARLAAAPLSFDPSERPFATGILPPFSAAGYLCYIARAADPADAMGPGTAVRVHARSRRESDARLLAQAVVIPQEA